MIVLSIPIDPNLYNFIKVNKLEVPELFISIPDYYTHLERTISIRIEKYNFRRYENNIFDTFNNSKMLSYVRLSGIRRYGVNECYPKGSYKYNKNRQQIHQVYIQYPIHDYTIDFVLDTTVYGMNGEKLTLENPYYIKSNYKDLFEFLKYFRSDICRITFSKNYQELRYNISKSLNNIKASEFKLRYIDSLFEISNRSLYYSYYPQFIPDNKYYQSRPHYNFFTKEKKD